MKNIKLSKRLLSMLAAGILMGTPVMANAESEKESDNGFALYVQTTDYKPFNVNEYEKLVERVYGYLESKIEYPTLQQDLQCLLFLINHDYMPVDDEDFIIGSGFVFGTDIANGKFEDFSRSYNVINVILDFNESKIRNTDNIDDLIDPSEFCFDENDKKLVHDMHVNYFNAYKNNLFYNEDFEEAFKRITTLNAVEKNGNVDELSIGANWISKKIIGNELMQLLRDYMRENFSRKELDKYFDKKELNQEQWILRDDLSLDLNECYDVNSLEFAVSYFGQLWHFVYDVSNNDILKSFEVNCKKSK